MCIIYNIYVVLVCNATSLTVTVTLQDTRVERFPRTVNKWIIEVLNSERFLWTPDESGKAKCFETKLPLKILFVCFAFTGNNVLV